MPCFKCVACNMRDYGTESEGDQIGDLCPVCGSLLERAGDRVETHGSILDSGASGAGQLIAGRVGEIIARREFRHARVRLGIERCDAYSLSPRVLAVSSRAPGTRRRGRQTPPRRSYHSSAAATAANPRSFRRGASSARAASPKESSHSILVGRPRSDVGACERRGLSGERDRCP
jgi:hypothetical protein